ncbi:MAG: hypothetical protein LBQ50_00965 [Planctomycetaceae bacterium]|jgi:hypothetical protein|nr:hypothetical protein [Planctomycetaceae bacterium]
MNGYEYLKTKKVSLLAHDYFVRNIKKQNRPLLRIFFLFCPFRAMDAGKIVTHRVAVGWLILPLAGRISEIPAKIIPPQKTK